MLKIFKMIPKNKNNGSRNILQNLELSSLKNKVNSSNAWISAIKTILALLRNKQKVFRNCLKKAISPRKPLNTLSRKMTLAFSRATQVSTKKPARPSKAARPGNTLRIWRASKKSITISSRTSSNNFQASLGH